MSHVALANAVRDTLRETLPEKIPDLVGDAVQVMVDGEPDPVAGQWFVAISQGEWRDESHDRDLSERLGLEVTVTRRLGYAPEDRWGPETWASTRDGLYLACRTVLATVHLSETVRIRANKELGLTYGGAGGFVEALRFRSGGRPEKKGPDWFGAVEARDSRRKVANAGLACVLTFGDCLRVQGAVGQELR